MITLFVIPLLGFALLFWAYLESKRRHINVHKVRLVKKTLPQPLRILHLSDIHFSGPDPDMARFFDKLAAQSYDLIVVTGDIFDCEAGIGEATENFRKLHAPFGIYAVFGNHDYYDYRLWDIVTMGLRGRRHPETKNPSERFAEALAKAGVRLLVNERAEFRMGSKVFSIYGLDDPTTGRADIEKAMHHYDPDNINILLTHTLDAFFYIGEGEIDLSFSGHSHGGQIQLPFIGPVITHTQFGPDYVEGIQEMKGAVCSISRGLGVSRFIPLRLLAPAEAIVLEVEGQ